MIGQLCRIGSSGDRATNFVQHQVRVAAVGAHGHAGSIRVNFACLCKHHSRANMHYIIEFAFNYFLGGIFRIE